jgi:hypothetical protein
MCCQTIKYDGTENKNIFSSSTIKALGIMFEIN